ncbi:hypothetical protein G7Y89_g8436 [Cudoniella acicularis]|uniref:Uncharacterized protein n=1 Tax=Cudoniella acicularis TaxID=354080 RepID=A0A8H4RIV7_9HELO|nr:hypothetical protein G7Y89_g8436 [Cudoniella acicularis]
MADLVGLAASTIVLVNTVTDLQRAIRDNISQAEQEAQARSVYIWHDLGEEIDDLNLYLTILSEMLDIINGASVEFPASVGLALKNCEYRASRISTYHEELATVTMKKASKIRLSSFELTSKDLLKRFEKASKNFRESVMLFRELVLGYCGLLLTWSVFKWLTWFFREVKTPANTVINYNDGSSTTNVTTHSGAQEDPMNGVNEENTPAIMNGKIRFHSPRNSNFVLNYNDGSSTNIAAFHGTTLPDLLNMQQGAGNSGPEFLSNNGDPWTVTFWTGAEDGVDVTTSKWHGIRAKPDTGANGNWVRRDIIERASMSNQIRPLVDHEFVYVDFNGTEHHPTETITLTWFLNSTTRTRKTIFFIAEAFPSDMLFGKEFLDGERDIDVGRTVLPLVGRHRHRQEEQQLEITRDAVADRDEILEAAERQQEAEERERYRKLHLAGASQTQVQTDPVSAVPSIPPVGTSPGVAAAITSNTALDSSSFTSSAASATSLPLLVNESSTTLSTSTAPSVKSVSTEKL